MVQPLLAHSIISHYRIVSKLGEGGMGEVWLAEDMRLGRKVALKLLPAEFTEDSERIRRFTQEAKAASALNHPNIISVHDIGECESGRFIVMEFVAGRTLGSVITKDNSLETFFALGTQMARALSAAHAAGITHRDIKPDNIMVRDDGYVKMLDFGLARLHPTTASDPEAMTLAQQTTPGTVMGTLAYMSPEQASGQTVGSPSDVFALGIVLYELATGSHPFKSETMIGYLHAITSQAPPSMTSIKSHLPPALDDLISHMLEKDANSRPTASEVAQALQEIEKCGSSNTLPFRAVAEKPKVSGAEEGFWVAVLPLKYRGNNADLEALAEGLSEDIITGLSRFSCLRVIARGSTLRFTSVNADVRSIGKQLGARYVMEGSLRQAGSMLRLVVQLVDATTGAHLWAETYDRTIDAETIFALQDELVPRIVSTVADWYGVLTHSMSEAVRLKPIDQVTPYEAVLRSFGYYERVTAEEHAAARSALERAVEQAPGNADGWAMLSMMYGEEFRFGFNEQPDPMSRSLRAARRAVDIAPSNHFAYLALAQAFFFRKEFDAFRHAAERAIALNSMDGSTMEYVGHLIAFSGDWDYGCEVAERARQLNPNHPGWYWAVPFYNAYRNGDYPTARAFALKIDQPTVDLCQVMLAAVYGQLGEHEAADRTVQTLLSLTPDTAVIRKQLDKWYQPELVDKLIDGLRKAGLDIGDADVSLSTSTPSEVSSETRAGEGFWVAVLPFKSTGTNAELATLSDGLSDEIITGLNRFSYLRVIARSSTFQYASQTSDVRTVGRSLGARYVMEGSLRQAGTKMRLAVQLVDTTSGAHLWAENYERTFSPESIFDLQDELVPRIVSTIADSHGVLPRSMSEAVQSRTPEELSPYEAVLRSFNYTQNVTPTALSDSVFCLELAVQKAPAYADAWAMLGAVLAQDYAQGYNVRVDSLARAEEASRKAVELAPSNHWAWASLARVHFFKKELQSFRDAVEKAVALNTMDGDSHASLGEMLTFSGAGDRGLELVERAKQLNPNHPGWYWYANFYQAYKQRDYRAALNFALKVNLPGHWAQPLFTAAASGQLGETESAAKAVRELLKLRPDVSDTVRKDFMKWWSSEDVEHLLEGLRKAGLKAGDGEKEVSVNAEPLRRDAVDVDLTTASSSSHSSLIKSIAVLPFQNLSVDPEQEFFADGITEEILNALAQIKDLRVAGRSSSFSFKGRNEDLRSVGAKLNVSSLLEGTLRRSGDRLRITAQLIDAVSGYQLWSERYDRVVEDIFDIQDEIALAVVDALKLKLFGDTKEAVVRRYTDDAEVHELFLKGRYYSYKYTAEGWTRAVEFFEKVIEKQPGHAPAYAGKAAALGCLWFFGLSPADEAVPRFRSAATKAISLDGNLAGAHLSLGMVNFFHDWEWEKAEQEFKQAILLNPKDAEALSYYAMFLGFVDRFDEAMALCRRALEVDPLSLLINMNVAWTYFSAGLANEAFDQASKMTEIEPGFFGAYWLKGATRLESGDYEEAIEQLTKAVSLGGHPIVLADLGAAYALAGKKETAETILNQLLDMRRQSYVPAICLARVYSRLGELEKTVQWLETAYEERNGELVFLESEITSAAQGDSLNSLSKDPRVKHLLERMKLPSRDQESK